MAEVYLEHFTPQTVTWNQIPSEFHAEMRAAWRLPPDGPSVPSTSSQSATVIDVDESDSEMVPVGAAAASYERVAKAAAESAASWAATAAAAAGAVNVQPMGNTWNPIANCNLDNIVESMNMDTVDLDELMDVLSPEPLEVPEEVEAVVAKLISTVCTRVANATSKEKVASKRKERELEGIQEMRKLQQEAAMELFSKKPLQQIVYKFGVEDSYCKGDYLQIETSWGSVKCCLPTQVRCGQTITFSVPRPTECSDSLYVIGKPFGLHGAEGRCRARIRAKTRRTQKRKNPTKAASTEQCFQTTATDPLELLTDTALAAQTSDKQQPAAGNQHSCTEASDSEKEECDLPKPDDGPSVYSKHPECSICLESLSLDKHRNFKSPECWGYTNCCGKPYHKVCLLTWLQPAKTQDWTSSHSKKVSIAKVCPTCKSDKVTQSNTRMFCTDATPGAPLPKHIRSRRPTTRPTSPRSHRNSRMQWHGRDVYMNQQLDTGGSIETTVTTTTTTTVVSRINQQPAASQSSPQNTGPLLTYEEDCPDGNGKVIYYRKTPGSRVWYSIACRSGQCWRNRWCVKGLNHSGRCSRGVPPSVLERVDS
ncbi:MAG: hypothetical protein CMM02_03865 [Rhodopirellula sp.]|jgi:hypothetical protein|nr:hypothetical protein [Rhodopirellula sp.]